MSASTDEIPGTLPREMMQHTYPILYAVEESHWWYIGRRSIIRSFVKQICDRVTDRRARILDVGCGTGANLVLLSEFGDAQGVDVSPDALAFCRERGLENVRLGAAEALPYGDDEFDLVTAFDVVEHMDDDVAGLREMRRVLRPGGRLLLFVPTFMFLWGVQDEVSNHRRRYRLAELRRAVTASGFEVERTTHANITFFLPVLVVRKLMRLTGIRTETENSINIPALNRLFGMILGAERHWLRYMNLPFGVSGLCVARRIE
ncbi:MAG TPA: methyltransferase domain-containing protein [Pyrinomonadaceae bacterium]|nr:methyltransferase domain-containing protein [Pyrinomonadaceae bacterium]